MRGGGALFDLMSALDKAKSRKEHREEKMQVKESSEVRKKFGCKIF